jgi:hypothetical protein
MPTTPIQKKVPSVEPGPNTAPDAAVKAPSPEPAVQTPTDRMGSNNPQKAQRSIDGGHTNPAGLSGLHAPRNTPVISSSKTAATQASGPNQSDVRDSSYATELSTYRQQAAEIAGQGATFQHRGRSAALVGAALSTPAHIVNASTDWIPFAAESAKDWAMEHIRQGDGWRPLAAFSLPFIFLFQGLGKVTKLGSTLIDLPFKGLRALIQRLAPSRNVAVDDLSEATHRRVDVNAWPTLATNAATYEAIAAHQAAQSTPSPYELIIVPGYATRHQTIALNPKAASRLDQAVRDYHAGLAPFILVSGGNVHPADTPFNEAFEMRRYLIEEHNIPANRILVEPMAKHSTTNLRNAGRIMRRVGMQRALITSSPQAFGQSFYFQTEFPFYAYTTRATAELGYTLGTLQRIDNHHTGYLPSADVDLVTLEQGQHPSSDP